MSIVRTNIENVRTIPSLAPATSPTFTGTATANNLSVSGTLSVTSNTVVTNLNADLLDGQNGSYYASINSPTFTGTPTAPTATTGTNTTQIATTSFVRGEISALVNSAPAALDTLGELATALGNDSNFATTVTNSLATKAPLSSPTFTGTVATSNLSVSGTLSVTSTTAVTNLNADMLDGQHGSYYMAAVSPSSNGNILTSNGSSWISSAPAASGVSTGKAIAMSMIFG